MSERRVQRLNSLLKEVISDVIHQDVKNPHLPKLITVTRVEVSKDLHHAKVYISAIGDDAVKKEAIAVLQSAANFIAVHASKKVVMRFFPELLFIVDSSLEAHMKIEELIYKIQQERKSRESES